MKSVGRTTKKAVCAALLSVSALFSSGCSNQADVAIIIGEDTITSRQLEVWVEACARAFEAPDMRAYVLNAVVTGRIAADIMADNGIEYSDEERRDVLLQTSRGLMMLADTTCGQVGYGVADSLLLYNDLGAAAFGAAVEGYEVVLNPRYGYWDVTSATALGNGSLSEEVG